MEFHEIFDKYLTEHGITSYKMSIDTGISSSLIGYWRRGQRKPTLDNIIAISNYLDLSTDFLLKGQNHLQLRDGERELLAMVHKLSDKEQQRVIGVVESYLDKRNISKITKTDTDKTSTFSDEKFCKQFNENFTETLEVIKKLAE